MRTRFDLPYQRKRRLCISKNELIYEGKMDKTSQQKHEEPFHIRHQNTFRLELSLNVRIISTYSLNHNLNLNSFSIHYFHSVSIVIGRKRVAEDLTHHEWIILETKNQVEIYKKDLNQLPPFEINRDTAWQKHSIT